MLPDNRLFQTSLVHSWLRAKTDLLHCPVQPRVVTTDRLCRSHQSHPGTSCRSAPGREHTPVRQTATSTLEKPRPCSERFRFHVSNSARADIGFLGRPTLPETRGRESRSVLGHHSSGGGPDSLEQAERQPTEITLRTLGVGYP